MITVQYLNPLRERIRPAFHAHKCSTLDDVQSQVDDLSHPKQVMLLSRLQHAPLSLSFRNAWSQQLNWIRNRDARLWSNDALRKIGATIGECSTMINVSGWRDSDKEGGKYRNYFPNVCTYHVSNHPHDNRKGLECGTDIALDLDAECPDHLASKYDLVLNHTVLEHVPRPDHSFSILSRLCAKVLITVVPFKQPLHFEEDQFGDFHRFTPMAMRHKFASHDLDVVFEDASPGADTIYLVHVGTRSHAATQDCPSKLLDLSSLNHKLGATRAGDVAAAILNRTVRAILR